MVPNLRKKLLCDQTVCKTEYYFSIIYYRLDINLKNISFFLSPKKLYYYMYYTSNIICIYNFSFRTIFLLISLIHYHPFFILKVFPFRSIIMSVEGTVSLSLWKLYTRANKIYYIYYPGWYIVFGLVLIYIFLLVYAQYSKMSDDDNLMETGWIVEFCWYLVSDLSFFWSIWSNFGTKCQKIK